MRKATDQRDAQTISLLWTSLLLFHGGDVTCFDACHVIWCGGQVIWCDVIACVVSCHVMQCDVMCPAMVTLCVSKWFCDDVVIQVLFCTTKCYSVLQSTTPALLCTTKYYSSTTLYYKVLLQYYSVLQSTLQYYSVLQSTTPVLLCTAKYYSSTSTTLYYKVLLQYYSVLQSTTPVLLCTEWYYNVLLQYCTVLQCTTPVLPCTTKYYSNTTLYYKVLLCTTTYYSSTTLYYRVLQRTTASNMKRHLQCAEQQESPSNFTKYCACHAKWMSSVIRVTYETSFPMRGASKVTLQTHQVLRLPRNSEFKISARSPWIASAKIKTIRRHSEDIPRTSEHEIVISHPPLRRPDSSHLGGAFCMEKYNIWRSGYQSKFHEVLPLPRKVTLQLHQILRLPRKMHLMIDPRHRWNVIYNKRSKHSQPPTSPNTAPATKSVSSRFQRKLRELLPPIERRFDDIPNIIRT